MYKSHLLQLDVKGTERIHTTRLKNGILSQNLSVEELKKGRDVFLAFKSDLASVQGSFQASFFKEIKSLVATIEELESLFIEESKDQIVLDTKEIAGPTAVSSLRQIETVGMEQFNTFMAECKEIGS